MGHTLDGTLEVFVFVAGKIFMEFLKYIFRLFYVWMLKIKTILFKYIKKKHFKNNYNTI
jgi:hypothetical protein